METEIIKPKKLNFAKNYTFGLIQTNHKTGKLV